MTLKNLFDEHAENLMSLLQNPVSFWANPVSLRP